MKTSIKYFFIVTCIGSLLAAGYLGGIYAQQRRLPTGGFLQSTSTVIKLGVWDKMGNAKSNKTIFTVMAADGKKYTAEKSESLTDWVYVEFPESFSPYPETGAFSAYKWTATVDGKIIAGGNFKYGEGRSDDNNRNLK